MDTAVALLWTANAETQDAIPTGTPTFIPPTTIPGSFPLPALNSDQQVYVDPEGWYFVYFPSNLKKVANKPNYFLLTGEVAEAGFFFETGYLPEYGYMSNANNVCSWLANIDLRPPKNLAVDSYETYITYSYSAKCSAITKSNSGNAEITLKMDIYENPGADTDHRFIYVKTNRMNQIGGDAEVFGKVINYSFGWLRLVDQKRNIPNLEPISPAEMELWKDTAPILQGASVTEYKLPLGGSDLMPPVLINELPEEALPESYKNPQPYSTPIPTPAVEEQLKSLGYEMINAQSSDPYEKQLFRDGRLLFDHVRGVSEIYHFSTTSTTINAFIVYTRGVGGDLLNPNAFLIENDAIYAWYYNHQDPHYPRASPVLYQGNLLWPKTSLDFHHIFILKNNQDVVYSFATYEEPMHTVSSFTAWNDHWTLAARDFLIQDGESVNGKMGFEEIFEWRVVNNKPAYLFRKGPRIGFFYDGKILPLEYQDVARYLCCEPGVDNPSIGEHEARFFGRRNGVWYYVVIKF